MVIRRSFLPSLLGGILAPPANKTAASMPPRQLLGHKNTTAAGMDPIAGHKQRPPHEQAITRVSPD